MERHKFKLSKDLNCLFFSATLRILISKENSTSQNSPLDMHTDWDKQLN